MILAIDQGTTGTTLLRVRRAGRADRPGLPRVRPALPAAGLGRARSRARSGTVTRRSPARRSRMPARGPGDLDARRHHQPARDRLRVGSRHAASRCTTRSSGRTGARRRAASSCARQGHEPLVRARTGLVLDPYFSATKIAVAAGARGRPARARAERTRAVRHDRLVADVQADRRAPDRRDERLAHDALRHRARVAGIPSCSSCSACPSARCRACSPSAGAVRADAPRGAARARGDALRASPAISRRRCSATAASIRAWARTPTARARSC